jgi:hypothetical protein
MLDAAGVAASVTAARARLEQGREEDGGTTMKRRVLVAVGGVVLSLLVVGTVLAFSMGNVDGVWTTIDGGGDATDSTWATGPAGGSTDYDNPTSTDGGSPSVQGALGGTDWNQVRYGSGVVGGFGGQSGFGFDGVNDVTDPASPYVNVPFLLGKWCHFNSPIYSPDNSLEYVDLEIRVDGILCPDGSAPTPDTMEFEYRFFLDETTNSESPCPYLPGDPVNDNGCADAVDIGALVVDEGFVCDYGGASAEYTIQIIGFVQLTDPGASCPSEPSGSPSLQFISGEEADNCACLYARVTELTPTAVDLLSFEATGEWDAVRLSWETASETDNLGFNIYRAESIGGERTRLNFELITTDVAPGSPFGAVYGFRDTAVRRGWRIDWAQGFVWGATYYYWLEDVDIYGVATLHGPVEASPSGGPRVRVYPIGRLNQLDGGSGAGLK